MNDLFLAVHGVRSTSMGPRSDNRGYGERLDLLCGLWLRLQWVVKGRPNPATDGRLKTSHFERTGIRHLRLPTAPALWEARDGESAQNGVRRNTSRLTCP